MTPDPADAFIARWEGSGAAERANYPLLLSELCDLLEVARPEPTSAEAAKNLHVFERGVTRVNPDATASTGFIDLLQGTALCAGDQAGHHCGGIGAPGFGPRSLKIEDRC